MVRFLLRRLALTIVLLLGVTVMVFLISHLVPSNPVAANLSQTALADPEIVAAYEAKWGLDKPLSEQYFIYITNIFKGDFGTSIRTGRPILQDLKQYFPATLELSLLAMLIAIVFGISFGIISAVWQNKPIDQLLRAISVSGVSLPSFWFALLIMSVFSGTLKWFPSGGRINPRLFNPTGGTGLYLLDALSWGDWGMLSDSLAHLILPALVLGFFTMGLITRQTRSNLLETMSMDYIRTARAKGMRESRVVCAHALNNALIPVITVSGMGFCNLLGGMVFVEKIFSWPGIGQYAYLSAITLDFPAICGVSLLIAATYVVINLLIDILYGIIDPRIRYQ
ncbi:MAG TPA: ABC transporter permease [Oscillospiraceae bacterium]|nr:ABC transporter permease [Oscillospiraceae bacterium]